MAQNFLIAAEAVLRQNRSPMLLKDIYQRALDEQLIASSGITPLNTLRARLSEHIRKLKADSIFLRIAPNKFALREWDVKEYIAKPFEKDKRHENVVCVSQKLIDTHKRFFGFNEKYYPYLHALSNTSDLIVLQRENAKSRFDIKQLVSYVILKDKSGKYLSYIRGSYGQKESLLQGVLCLGFGGHVNKDDLNLFGLIDGGITNSANREIAEEVRGLKIGSLKPIGVINDDSSPLGLNHFAFVFEAKILDSANVKSLKRELSINKVSLLKPSEIWSRFHELEFWSQLVVKKFLPKSADYQPVFIKTKHRRFDTEPLVIVGEIGSGKSEVAKHINKKFKLPLVSTRACVEKLIPIKDFKTENRNAFQEEAIKLVSSKEGIEKLAEEIIKAVEANNSKCVIIDGVRNLETFSILKLKYPNIGLLYIDVPRDTAFRLYSTRSDGRKIDVNEFRKARHHEVEKEITLFKTRADAYLFNGGNLPDLYKAINKWWDERNKK